MIEIMTKKITIELTDYEIDWLARIGEVWAVNDGVAIGGSGSSSNSDQYTQEQEEQKQYSIETVAATLAANEARRLVQEYKNSRLRHIQGVS